VDLYSTSSWTHLQSVQVWQAFSRDHVSFIHNQKWHKTYKNWLKLATVAVKYTAGPFNLAHPVYVPMDRDKVWIKIMVVAGVACSGFCNPQHNAYKTALSSGTLPKSPHSFVLCLTKFVKED